MTELYHEISNARVEVVFRLPNGDPPVVLHDFYDPEFIRHEILEGMPWFPITTD